jgi:hypothetical protein
MRLSRARFTVWTLMVAVAVVAVSLGIYALGLRNGRQAVMFAPPETPLSYTKALAIPSEEEACAVFLATEMSTEHNSAFFSKFPIGQTSVTAKHRGDGAWEVKYINRRTGDWSTGAIALSHDSVQKYLDLLNAKQ